MAGSPNKREGFPMLLRDHPLMIYKGVRSWPPVWVSKDRNATTKNPKGEVGTLLGAVESHFTPEFTCFLIMEHRGAEYIGLLLLDDGDFCHQVVELLEAHCNRSIAEIGGVDVSHIL